MRSPDDARARDQIRRALAILDPPEAERATWVALVESALVLLRPERQALDKALNSKEGRAAIERYRAALRETEASYDALDHPSLREYLALVVPSDHVAREPIKTPEALAAHHEERRGENERLHRRAVELALLNVKKLLQVTDNDEKALANNDNQRSIFGRHPANRPIKRRERAAAWIAGKLLERRGFALTVGINGKWHRLTQVLAGTDHDLRRHLTALRKGAKAEKIVL
jgi:hypothetical protein